MFSKFCLMPSTVILNRRVFSGVGLFDETLPYHEDFEFFNRVLARYPLAVVDKLLMQYRRHEGNMSNNIKEMEQTVLRITEKMLRFPKNYPPGAGEHYLESLKMSFVARGRRLAQERKESVVE